MQVNPYSNLKENGHEYLSFLDAEYSQKINIYDIKNQKLIKTILLQKEGPKRNECTERLPSTEPKIIS